MSSFFVFVCLSGPLLMIIVFLLPSSFLLLSPLPHPSLLSLLPSSPHSPPRPPRSTKPPASAASTDKSTKTVAATSCPTSLPVSAVSHPQPNGSLPQKKCVSVTSTEAPSGSTIPSKQLKKPDAARCATPSGPLSLLSATARAEQPAAAIAGNTTAPTKVSILRAPMHIHSFGCLSKY